MYIFFDTETNGLPLNYDASVTDVNNWPRLMQIGWQIYDENYNLVREYCSLIKPDGWLVPEESEFHKEHGYTNARCNAEGVPVVEALQKFANEIDGCKYMIAHNMKFDKNVVGAEMIRANIRANSKPEKICTMLETVDFCKIKKSWGGYKWPQLMELYVKLFDEEFIGAHDALDDVKACAKSFFELKKRGIILKS